MLMQTTCDYCHSNYLARQNDQRFCSPSHNTMFYQKQKKERLNATITTLTERLSAQQANNEDLTSIKQENERLKRQNDDFQNSIKKQHEMIDELGIKIDNRDGIIIERNKEIERLRLEILKNERSKTKQ